MKPCWIVAIVVFICVLCIAFILHSYFVIPAVIQTYSHRNQRAQLAEMRLQSLQKEFDALEASENAALLQLRSQFNSISVPPATYDGRIDTKGKQKGKFTTQPVSRVQSQSRLIDQCYKNLAACLTNDPTQMSPCQNSLNGCLNGDKGIQQTVNAFIDGTPG